MLRLSRWIRRHCGGNESIRAPQGTIQPPVEEKGDRRCFTTSSACNPCRGYPSCYITVTLIKAEPHASSDSQSFYATLGVYPFHCALARRPFQCDITCHAPFVVAEFDTVSVRCASAARAPEAAFDAPELAFLCSVVTGHTQLFMEAFSVSRASLCSDVALTQSGMAHRGLLMARSFALRGSGAALDWPQPACVRR